MSCAAVCCRGCIWVCWVFLPLCPCAACWRCAATTTTTTNSDWKQAETGLAERDWAAFRRRKRRVVLLFHSLQPLTLFTCFSWISELTWTSQIWQWKVLFCRPEPFRAELLLLLFFSLAPGRGYALIGPEPLRASSIVLCFEPYSTQENTLFFYFFL